MKISEGEKADRFGNYPIWIRGKDANPQKVYEKLYEKYGGQGFKFAIIIDCSHEEWREPEEETPIYFLTDIFDEVIYYIGLEEARRRLNELTCPASTNDGWIPVEERLPEEHSSIFAKFKGTTKWNNAMFETCSNEVNITIEDDEGKSVTDHAHTNDGKWKCDLLRLNPQYHVTAWRPLPEPYRPERSEGE